MATSAIYIMVLVVYVLSKKFKKKTAKIWTAYTVEDLRQIKWQREKAFIKWINSWNCPFEFSSQTYYVTDLQIVRAVSARSRCSSRKFVDVTASWRLSMTQKRTFTSSRTCSVLKSCASRRIDHEQNVRVQKLSRSWHLNWTTHDDFDPAIDANTRQEYPEWLARQVASNSVSNHTLFGTVTAMLCDVTMMATLKTAPVCIEKTCRVDLEVDDAIDGPILFQSLSVPS